MSELGLSISMPLDDVCNAEGSVYSTEQQARGQIEGHADVVDPRVYRVLGLVPSTKQYAQCQFWGSRHHFGQTRVLRW
jgi:hypothetical protein